MNAPLVHSSKQDGIETNDIFRIVMIYEDMAAGRTAEHFVNSLIREFNDGCDCFQDLWNFKVLAIPEIAGLAAIAAANADVVIVSISSGGALNSTVKGWIESWVRLVEREDLALIVISPSNEQETHLFARFAECRDEVQYVLHERPMQKPERCKSL